MTATPSDQYLTRPLTPETWPDFAALVEANNGIWGGCWCMGFHAEGLDQNSTDWYGRDPQFGIGRRECKYLDVKLQVHPPRPRP